MASCGPLPVPAEFDYSADDRANNCTHGGILLSRGIRLARLQSRSACEPGRTASLALAHRSPLDALQIVEHHQLHSQWHRKVRAKQGGCGNA